MSITRDAEWQGMKKISEVVAVTLRAMMLYARPGMTTAQLDDYGAAMLRKSGAVSAPKATYDFPGHTCISLNHEIAHGIPSGNKILSEGDLVNIDVSAELNGYWADNGCSFVLGNDIHHHQKLVNASKRILNKALLHIKAGVRIAEIGRLIENEARKSGFKVIENLTGHGVGKGLHEAPFEIPNFYDRSNRGRFSKNSVVAVETFISTRSSFADTMSDGWTLRGDKGGYTAQHEHTIVVTDGAPVILTVGNGI
jgi:methionyl aminopeptidase